MELVLAMSTEKLTRPVYLNLSDKYLKQITWNFFFIFLDILKDFELMGKTMSHIPNVLIEANVLIFPFEVIVAPN